MGDVLTFGAEIALTAKVTIDSAVLASAGSWTDLRPVG